ncbi:unnamed protein product [Prunus brigantina]
MPVSLTKPANKHPIMMFVSLLLTLNSDPRSTGADVKGLGLIMVDAVKDKATGALNKADELLKQSPGDQALLSCVKTYNEVLQNDVPQGSQAFTQGDSKLAEQGMNDAKI